ncbi:C-terminal binding protein [Rhizobium fabae]|uniref:D-3-phosphoglycerate dehydrogenase n=1 Tax=Rhizobium fabae TaxID=573179 RepID=A0A7W6BED0_9HYPH|nr:C-terminal binding protein [Rhizobium fabae]MBB3917594.1 D-3-phosphoglycerate dehydrogenase [Rhizobium fabae]
MNSILITDHVFPNLQPEETILGDIGKIVFAGAASDEELRKLVRDADAILNCYRPLSVDMINAMEKCKIIARYGIGVDTIPLAAAHARGIVVTNVPDYCIEEVADHALALMLALTRGILRGVDQTRTGQWDITALRPLHRQRGRTVGLIGFGRIAKAFGERVKSLGYNVVAHDPYVSEEVFAKAGVQSMRLETVFECADVVSLHAPLTATSRHLVNSARLATMKSDAIIINTSRGGLIDFEALAGALKTGVLGAAGLDVLEIEPPTSQSTPIADVPNLIVTPHLGFYSEQAMVELQTKAALQVKLVLQGAQPDYSVRM